MFGIQFLFTAALWALPLAALPLLLHLLFRQRAPVIPFSTLRFIRSSLQQNATRRKVERWLLLACRALLMALLIWALAQPARKLTAGILGNGGSTAAAIVVDTSYSMQLQDQQRTLLQEADDSVQDLLRTELRDAQVAIFKSHDAPGHLQPAEAYRGDNWETLRPSPSPQPLIDRIDAAADLLVGSAQDNKWLIILTDSQLKEFPRPLPKITDGKTILIDLHPADVRTAAITDVRTEPAQPRLGIPAQVAIDLIGRPNDVRQMTLQITPAGQTAPTASPPTALPLAHFDATGRAHLRWPFVFSDSSWLNVTAAISSSESLPWAATRTELVRVPPRQPAAILTIGPANPQTVRVIRLALDPSEGQRTAWPITLHDGPPQWNESLIVAILDQWPDLATIQQMTDFVRSGGSLVFFIQPGLESFWSDLDAGRQSALAALLPSPPSAAPSDTTYRASIPNAADPLLAGMDNAAAAEERLVITRLVNFTGRNPIINLADDSHGGAVGVSGLAGLLFRRFVGDGTVFTWATLPDQTCGNLRVWDMFPATLVNAAKPPTREDAPNIEIGQPLTFPTAGVLAGAEVDLIPPPPDQKPIRLEPTGDEYVYSDTTSPGLYTLQWLNPTGQTGVIGYANVQLPASEADLRYRPMNEIVADAKNVIAGHSLDQIRERLMQLDEPHPQWTLPIALVLLLLCVEGLLGALPKRSLKKHRSGVGVLSPS
jgi:hypothetical protein